MSDIANMAEIRPHTKQHTAPHTEQHTSPHAVQFPEETLESLSETAPQTASQTVPHTAPQTAPPELKDLCVSEASEMTGHSQTTRNELYHLFHHWSSYSKTEEEDKLLRKSARELFVRELENSGVTVKYVLNKYNKQLMAVVTWDGKTAERIVVADGRSAARNAFVALLRMRKKWPVPDRPKLKPDIQKQPDYPLADTSLRVVSPCIQAAAEKSAAVKEVTQAELEAMHAELKAMRTELEQCKKAAEVAAEVATELIAEAIAEVAAELIAEVIAEVTAELIAELIAEAIAEVAAEVRAEAEVRAKAEAESKLKAMRIELEAMRTELEQYKKAEAEKAQIQPSLSSPSALIPVSAANSQTTTVVSMALDESEDAKAAASLIELMRDPQISERSGKKRDRDPSTRSGGSAQKKTKANDNDQEMGLMSSSVTNMDAVMERLSLAERKGEINTNSYKRLQMLQRLLNECERDGLITIKTNEINKCVLSWSKLLIKEPKKFHKKILDMIMQDQSGIWRKVNQTLKNPTLSVYELFRKIGVKPSFRGSKEDDPGKHDMLYYKEWEFKNDGSFEKARQLMVKGFNFKKKKPSLQEDDD